MSIIDKLADKLGFVRKSKVEAQLSEARQQGAANVAAFYAEREVTRFTQPVYEQFRKLVTAGNSTLTGTTTELQAGHIIGVNHALTILRDGFVVDSASAAKPV